MSESAIPTIFSLLELEEEEEEEEELMELLEEKVCFINALAYSLLDGIRIAFVP